MKGATEYAYLFKTGQYGRLYLVSGSHARGKTFRIQVLPEGEVARGNGSGNNCLNKDAVEVYGVVSGQPGWTEVYGWLHQGKWVNDFEKMVEGAQTVKLIEHRRIEELKAKRDKEESDKISTLLNNY